MTQPATITKTEVITPAGGRQTAWTVTSEDEKEVAIFTGEDVQATSIMATEFARANYKPINFKIIAEPGNYFSKGANLGKEAAHNGSL